ncbi:MAG: hypothetical protein P8N76_08185 [Pirellulaceae bacterium]|nr:hypothetical protein [Planctomycetaceae bacterium]MDG2381639.1 hypothetical protein [Pirellulaceae bacterium]
MPSSTYFSFWPVASTVAGTHFLPATSEDIGNAANLGIMEINLQDALHFKWGFQGAAGKAGAPNQAGIGKFFSFQLEQTAHRSSMREPMPTLLISRTPMTSHRCQVSE